MLLLLSRVHSLEVLWDDSTHEVALIGLGGVLHLVHVASWNGSHYSSGTLDILESSSHTFLNHLVILRTSDHLMLLFAIRHVHWILNERSLVIVRKRHMKD